MITKPEIDKLVKTYETVDFIKDDPIQIPHRFKNKKISKFQVLSHHWLLTGEENFL